MAVHGISAVQPAISPSAAADTTTSSGAVAGVGKDGGGSGGTKTIVSTVTVANSDGTITTTITYSDGTTSVSTTNDPNAPSKAAKTGLQPTPAKPIDTSNPAQLSALLNAQEQSGTDKIQARPKGDLADL